MLIYSYERDTEVQSEDPKLCIMCFVTPKHVIKIPPFLVNKTYLFSFPDLIKFLRFALNINTGIEWKWMKGKVAESYCILWSVEQHGISKSNLLVLNCTFFFLQNFLWCCQMLYSKLRREAYKTLKLSSWSEGQMYPNEVWLTLLWSEIFVSLYISRQIKIYSYKNFWLSDVSDPVTVYSYMMLALMLPYMHCGCIHALPLPAPYFHGLWMCATIIVTNPHVCMSCSAP